MALRLGILGLSEGNGHPYSWSAIINGYRPEILKASGFPAISEYLARQKFPDDQLAQAQVTHIWTQDLALSQHIASACYIPAVVTTHGEMLGQVDAILLARDDAENHLEMAQAFLDAGLPIYIDKPLAYDVKTAREIFSLEKYPGQIFTCTAIRFAREFQISQSYLESNVGRLLHVDAKVMKSWAKYAVHVVEPVLQILDHPSQIRSSQVCRAQDRLQTWVEWEDGRTASFTCLGRLSTPVQISLFGCQGFLELIFKDTFYAFREALRTFVEVALTRKNPIPSAHVLDIVKVIEIGIPNPSI
jgi:predicted dehydrogenase